MAKIQSKYLGREFSFEPANMTGDDGNPITIIPHNILFDIIQNQLQDQELVSYEYKPHLITRDHSFVECVMSDQKGRFVREFGESVPESLKSEISKTIPGTMAAIRAFDRAAIRFLDFACEGKVYSDNEISADSLKPAGQSGRKGTSQPAGKAATQGAPKKETKAAASKPEEKPAQPAAPAAGFAMAVPAVSKWRDGILEALNSHDELITFDTETTGLSSTDVIMEIAAKKFKIDHGSGTFKLMDELQLYINPERVLDPKVVDLTGITDEFLADKPTETEAFIDIYNFFGENPQILCGYNTGFDVRYLSDLYKRQGKALNCGCKLDVCIMAKELVTGIENYKLGTVCAAFGMTGDDFHTATADADYTMKLFETFVDAYRKSAGAPAAPAKPAAAPVPAAAPAPVAAPAPAEPETVPAAEPAGKLQPAIRSMTLFKPSQAVRRIYVNTDAQNIYYDLVKKQWVSKDGDLSELDMEYLQKEAWKIAGASSQADFEAFEGKWVAETELKAA